ncbi:hydroxymethylglutaryl-CoA reductase, degradative [Ligilactobacillus faecis]|uniref:3-hydroxy-3-methylglutaryl coenzyme A reductase n=1 Tax=Ligilactobacillus faecis TaxID=762833 RepID=A0ABV4DRG3_9LACO
MEGFEKYYQKDHQTRLDILKQKKYLDQTQLDKLQASASEVKISDAMIENFITEYHLPEGLALNYVVDGQEYLIPFVTEEPSVVAAASHGAALVKRAGGFKTTVTERLMIGQIILENVAHPEQVASFLESQAEKLLALANAAHPSIVKRGGGAQALKVRVLAPDLISLDLIVDVKEAMGANMLNTMLEACATYLQTKLGLDVLISILSNYATRCLAKATCALPVELLTRNGLSGAKIAQKIATASRVAQLDPYRATTHNKGIMNGIDAVVLASGNDWRAIEAGAHAYAARDGQYRGLSTWIVKDDILYGELELPLPLGTVGGSIGIVPLVKINQQLLRLKDARQLEAIVAAVGLGQNLAALYALVTDGIQKGHMRLQLKSLALSVGATKAELEPVVSRLEALQARDQATAKKVLEELRNKQSERSRT